MERTGNSDGTPRLHVAHDITTGEPITEAPPASQSTLPPHAQADGSAAEPSVVAQTGPLRHLFWDR